MSRPPRLAIGMPVRNGERYLRQALDCHLGQTFEDFVVHVGDNASTDATAEICLEYARRDPRIVHHRNPRNLGAAGNFNAVFRMSDTELFRWSADDDILLPDYFARCIERLDADASMVQCHSLIGVIDAEGRRVGNQDELLTLLESRPSRRLAASFRLVYPGPVWSVMRRQAVARTRLHGGYLGSDWNFLAEMLLQGGIGLIPEVLFLVRSHASQFSSTSFQTATKAERLKWFNPDARTPASLSAVWSLVHFVEAVLRHPMPARERVACLWHIAARTGRKTMRKAGLARSALLPDIRRAS